MTKKRDSKRSSTGKTSRSRNSAKASATISYSQTATNSGAAADPARLSIEQLATLLGRASGESITDEHIKADVSAGAPVNEDGSMNLLHYTAWLASLRETRSKP